MGNDHTIIVGSDDGDGDDGRTVLFGDPDSGPDSRSDPRNVRSSSPREGGFASDWMERGDGRPLIRHSALLDAALPALMLATRLRAHRGQMDIDALRTKADREMRRYHKRILEAGLKGKNAMVAHYFVCATIDDVVLNTPWGGRTGWTRHNMVTTFHIDAEGGDKVPELAETMCRNPAKHRDLLELAYLCLSLGFEGRFRVDGDGSAGLARLRESLHAALVQVDGAPPTDLSPHWRGSGVAHRVEKQGTPPWVAAVGGGVLALLAFIGFSLLIDGEAARAGAALPTWRRDAPIHVAFPPPPVVPTPTPPPPLPPIVAAEKPPEPPPPPPAERVRKFLETEIAQRMVEVSETADRIVVRLMAPGMFASGSASVEERFVPMIRRVAGAMEAEKGAVLITGHTDNIPIAFNRRLKYRSNLDLSQARADDVLRLVRDAVEDDARFTAKGLGEAEPVADNGTPEGRAANRRIDLVLRKNAS